MSIRVLQLKSGSAPIVSCDHCGERISDAATAVAAHPHLAEGEGATEPCAHLHKGPCHLAWEKRQAAHAGWGPLSTHFAQLLFNVGLELPEDVEKAWGVSRRFDVHE